MGSRTANLRGPSSIAFATGRLYQTRWDSVAITVGWRAVPIGRTGITIAIIGVASSASSDGTCRKTGNAEADRRAGSDSATTTAIRVSATITTMAVSMAMTIATMTVPMATRASLGGGHSGKAAERKGESGNQSKLAHGIL